MLPEEDYRVQQLLNGGDCTTHWHSEDRVPTQDFLHGLQSVAYTSPISSDTTLMGSEDFVFVDTSLSDVTITLPRATGQREITIVKTSQLNTLTVVTTAPDTILGLSSVAFTTQWTSRTFKGYPGDWAITGGLVWDRFPQGAWYDTTSQYDGSTTIPYAFRLNSTSYSDGITVQSRTVSSTSSIALTTLTCTAIASGRFYPSMILSGTGVTSGTYIYLQLSSTATPISGTQGFVSGGLVGTTAFVVSGGANQLEARQFVSGTGVPANTRVVSAVYDSGSGNTTIVLSAAFTVQASGNYVFRPWGYQGTYSVSPSQTVASTTVIGALPSMITASQYGLYNIQFSAQLSNPSATEYDIDIWFKKNDQTIPNSNSQFTVPKKHGVTNGHVIAGLNFFIDLDVGEYVEIVWRTEDSQVFIEAIPPQTNPLRPATPSIIVTANYVSSKA